jgi:P27 family predicted phage terminase small subunit
MGLRGPAKKPTGPRHQRREAAGQVVAAPVERPPVPPALTEPQRATWERLCDTLERLSLLSTADWAAMERYCVLLHRWREAEDFLQRVGSTYNLKTTNPSTPHIGAVESNRDGQRTVEYLVAVVPYPQVKIARELAAELVKVESRFGLSPSARSGLLAQAATGPTTGGVRSRPRPQR